MRKKIISLMLALVMCFSLAGTAFAYDLVYDALDKAAALFQEQYPDVPYSDIRSVLENFLSNDGIDTAAVREALDRLVARYTTQAPPETTTKAPEHTTKKPETPGTTSPQTPSTTKKEESTTKNYDIPTRDSNNGGYTLPNNNNNNGNGNGISINLPDFSTAPTGSVTVTVGQNVTVVTMPQQNVPINNNQGQQNAGTVTDNPSGISNKKLAAWVIIAVGALLLLVSTIVLISSKDSKKRKRVNLPSSVKDDYVPFGSSDTEMPEVTVNTAADLAAIKSASKFISADELADEIDIADIATASALDDAVTVSAEKSDKPVTVPAPETAAEPVRTVSADDIFRRSVKKSRICEECGENVDSGLMFCPECGNFMGIVEEDTANV